MTAPGHARPVTVLGFHRVRDVWTALAPRLWSERPASAMQGALGPPSPPGLPPPPGLKILLQPLQQ